LHPPFSIRLNGWFGENCRAAKILCCAYEKLLRERSWKNERLFCPAKQTSEQIAANVCIPPNLVPAITL
jgi:hypothetical protein